MNTPSTPPPSKGTRVRLTPEMKAYLKAESQRTGIPVEQLLQLVVARSRQAQQPPTNIP